MLAGRGFACILGFSAVLGAAGAFDQVFSQRCRDEGENEVKELHLCSFEESVVVGDFLKRRRWRAERGKGCFYG